MCLTLGEAYAFGVVWSFVFKALSMLVLRFKQPSHREYEVPLNFRVGKYDVPVGISLIFLVLAGAALANLLTKEVATIAGSLFTVILFTIFFLSERAHHQRLGSSEHHEHLEQFNQAFSEQLTPQGLSLTKPYRKLVAIRSPYNLGMLEKCLNETDPETTEVVVMTATVLPPASADYEPTISDEDRHLLTAVVNLAEHAGKPVRPVIVPTNEPFYALTQTAKTIGAQELIMGPSNKYRPEDQLDAVALYWLNVCGAKPEPLSIRVLGKDRDMRLDIAGGSQIPKPGAAAAESAGLLADLRKSWHGVERLLLAYDGSPLSADFLDTVMSFLDPAIAVTLIDVAEEDPDGEGPADPDRRGQRGDRARRGARSRARPDRRLQGCPGPARPGDRSRGRRRQVRRHLHEPAWSLPARATQRPSPPTRATCSRTPPVASFSASPPSRSLRKPHRTEQATEPEIQAASDPGCSCSSRRSRRAAGQSLPKNPNRSTHSRESKSAPSYRRLS